MQISPTQVGGQYREFPEFLFNCFHASLSSCRSDATNGMRVASRSSGSIGCKQKLDDLSVFSQKSKSLGLSEKKKTVKQYTETNSNFRATKLHAWVITNKVQLHYNLLEPYPIENSNYIWMVLISSNISDNFTRKKKQYYN